MKNFEIPESEINALEPFGDYYDDDIIAEDDTSDVFPATFKIARTVIEAFFRERNIDLANVKIFNSEGDGYEPEFPELTKLMSTTWDTIWDKDNKLSEDLYFQYGWNDNYTHIYEITINNKPSLLLDVADGTSGTHFSMLEFIIPA